MKSTGVAEKFHENGFIVQSFTFRDDLIMEEWPGLDNPCDMYEIADNVKIF